MKADTNDLSMVEVIAAAYREDIYAATETGWVLEPVIREELVPPVPPVPKNVVVSFRSLTVSADTDYVLSARWDDPVLGGQFIIGYQVQYKRGAGGTWSQVVTTVNREVEFSPVPSGTYFVRVSAMVISGGMGNWSESTGAIAGSTTNMYLDFTRPQSMLVL